METHPILTGIKKKIGFVPNIYSKMVLNPAVLKTYLQGNDILTEGVLSPLEAQVVALTVSTYNSCDYCIAAHSTLLMAHTISAKDIHAIRHGKLPSEESNVRYIVTTTRKILDKKGFIKKSDLLELEKHGISREKIYEIITWIGLKTITNYINHIEHTEIDPQFST